MKLENVLRQAVKKWPSAFYFQKFIFAYWSQFAFGNSPPPPQNQTFQVGSFGYLHLVVWSQFAFGNSPPPPPRLPRFDQNFLDTGLGFALQRIFLRKTNKTNPCPGFGCNFRQKQNGRHLPVLFCFSQLIH